MHAKTLLEAGRHGSAEPKPKADRIAVAYDVGVERLLRLRGQSACLHLTSATFSPDGRASSRHQTTRPPASGTPGSRRCQRKVIRRSPARWAGVTKLSRPDMRLAGHHRSKGLPAANSRRSHWRGSGVAAGTLAGRADRAGKKRGDLENRPAKGSEPSALIMSSRRGAL
jgi:hypothetical protein